ncbi:MAG: MFS transporter [Hyphomicrobiaceae bacterium]|nr:MFS transporter [Hyphomicrobiaceae bacterium]
MALSFPNAAGAAAAPASEIQTLATISTSHLISHIHLLTLPVLIPLLKDRLGASFLELGLAITLFSVVSGLTQAPMGFLVDRIGARAVLIAGLCLGAFSFALLGLWLSYPMLFVCAALAGLANCVYHPADYAILSQAIAEDRIGRAFSIHTFAGYVGFAVAPAILLWTARGFGLGAALLLAGALAAVAALVLLLLPPPAVRETPPRKGAAAAPGLQGLSAFLTPTILSLVAFFTVFALSNSAMNSFAVTALMQGQGLTLLAANAALTAYLAMSALGVLAGGYLADRTHRHGDVAAFGFGLNAVCVLCAAFLGLPAALVVLVMGLGGFLSGIIMPSRDMLVRKASPPGAAGRVFGLVSTGFNIGGIIGPILFGYILDHAPPLTVLAAAAVFMLLTALYGFVSDRRAARASPA